MSQYPEYDLPRLLSYRGAQDGIRRGDIVLAENTHRRFTHDLISGVVRLFAHDAQHLHAIPQEDTDLERLAAANLTIVAYVT